METHPDFKTVHPEVCDARTMHQYVGHHLAHQDDFDKITPPGERRNWDEGQLRKFKINLRDIDRLYYISNKKRCWCVEAGAPYQTRMIARMVYKNPPPGTNPSVSYKRRVRRRRLRSSIKQRVLEPGPNNNNDKYYYYYIELTVIAMKRISFCYPILLYLKGSIFLSRDANLFMKIILREHALHHCVNRHLIYKSLFEDGIEVEELPEYELLPRLLWNNPPTLKYWCHQTAYHNRLLIDYYRFSTSTPKILRESVKEFIKTEEAKLVYPSYNWYRHNDTYSCDYIPMPMPLPFT